MAAGSGLGRGVWPSLTNPSTPPANCLSLQDYRWCHLPWERQRKGSRPEAVRQGHVPGQDSWLGQVCTDPQLWGEHLGEVWASRNANSSSNCCYHYYYYCCCNMCMYFSKHDLVLLRQPRLRAGRCLPQGAGARTQGPGRVGLCSLWRQSLSCTPIQGLREEAGEVHGLCQRRCGQQCHL